MMISWFRSPIVLAVAGLDILFILLTPAKNTLGGNVNSILSGFFSGEGFLACVDTYALKWQPKMNID